MSEVFDVYERQYCELSSNLTKKCSELIKYSGEQRKQKIQEINNGLDEANSLIRRMDLEARTLSISQRAILLAKIREYTADLTLLKRKIITTDSSPDQTNDNQTAFRNDSERSRLLTCNERINQSTERIREGKKTLLETEEIGVTILQDLHQQRQTLLHTRDTLHSLDDNITKARQILNSMGRRMTRNKWVTALIISVLLIAIAVVIYLKASS